MGTQSTDPTRSFYDRISRVYDLLADHSEHEARVAGLEALGARPGEAVLEIGFGTGHALVDLAHSVGPAGRVCGIDLSPGMRTVAERRLDEAGLREQVELETGDARALPWDDASFDAVFLAFTLELFEPEDIPRVLAEVRRVLRRGTGGGAGRLGLVSLTAGEHPGPIVELYRWLHRHFPHFVDCQPIDAAGWLEGSGFAIQTERELSIWGLPVAVLVARAALG